MGENGHGFGKLDSDASDPAEVRAAQQLSEQIDRMLAGQPVDLEDSRLAAADNLSRLGHLLPPVNPAFERRVMSQLQSPARRRLTIPLPRFPVRALSLAAAMLVVLVAFVLTVPGQTVLARLAAIFQLDTVKVGINMSTATPAETHRILTPRIERSLDSLEAVQQVAPVPIHVPQALPASWSLTGATAVYYPDLPANVPLNIILAYESTAGGSLEIIEYFVRLGDHLSVDSLSRIDERSTAAREVSLSGRRAILVESGGATGARVLIWQQDGLLFEVEARGVSTEDLFSIAASMEAVK